MVKDVAAPEKVAQIILTHIQLPEDNYRMGKTKVLLYRDKLLIQKTAIQNIIYIISHLIQQINHYIILFK